MTAINRPENRRYRTTKTSQREEVGVVESHLSLKCQSGDPLLHFIPETSKQPSEKKTADVLGIKGKRNIESERRGKERKKW